MRLPVNSPTENQNTKSNSQPYTPIITTFVTFSSRNENFSIARIDKKGDNWIYTEGDSCLAWKWSGDNSKQNLILSMERNLQIRDSNIKSVIFLVSLPRKIKEAGGVKVNLIRYAWDKTTSRLGSIENFKREYYPEILGILREKESRITTAQNDFLPGKPVTPEMR